MPDWRVVTSAIEAMSSEHQQHPDRLYDISADQLIADWVESVLDEDRVHFVTWFSANAAFRLFRPLIDEPEASLYRLLYLAFHDRNTHSLDKLELRRWLLGSLIRPSSLATEPFRTRLRSVNGATFAIGMVRVGRLYDALEDGVPPKERYDAAERALIDRVVPAEVRRFRRAFRWFGNLASDTRDRNDRAERINSLWLLHPVGGRLSRYLEILHSAYVDGRTTEVIILSRSVLERAVADVAYAYDLGPRDRMNDRLKSLLNAGLITNDAVTKARIVWQRGNKVIHDDPDLILPDFETVELLLAVLDELAPLAAALALNG